MLKITLFSLQHYKIFFSPTYNAYIVVGRNLYKISFFLYSKQLNKLYANNTLNLIPMLANHLDWCQIIWDASKYTYYSFYNCCILHFWSNPKLTTYAIILLYITLFSHLYKLPFCRHYNFFIYKSTYISWYIVENLVWPSLQRYITCLPLMMFTNKIRECK